VEISAFCWRRIIAINMTAADIDERRSGCITEGVRAETQASANHRRVNIYQKNVLRKISGKQSRTEIC